MTLKAKLAKAKLINKYTIERDNYMKASKTGGKEYVDFNAKKAAAYQSKIDALNEVKQ
tara:strand:- start:425 stop:598 length:174 start_codon:yes stop_codon:yes gene_type:complete